MSGDNIEIVKQSLAAWNRRDFDAFVSYFDPACEASFRPDVPEPGPFHGQTELRGWVDGFRGAWESHQAEVVAAEDAGNDVFVLLRLVGRAAGSSIETDDTWPFLYTIREGLIFRWRGFGDADEARKAAGL